MLDFCDYLLQGERALVLDFCDWIGLGQGLGLHRIKFGSYDFFRTSCDRNCGLTRGMTN